MRWRPRRPPGRCRQRRCRRLARTRPLAGWSVRDVYRNAALIQGTKLGMMEVSPGDNIPGLGRIHSIRQQDGRWVVVTSRGIIAQPR